MKYIDSFRHMSQSLSNLVDNLGEPRKNLPIDTLIVSITHMRYAIKILINLSYYYVKAFIHMNI